MAFTKRFLIAGALLLAFANTTAAQRDDGFTRADTLRGSWTTPGRVWWDVTFYDLNVRINPADSTIRGYNAITYKVLEPAQLLQIDLMKPLEIDSMVQDGKSIPFEREGNVFFAKLPSAPAAGSVNTITVHYHGRPQIAKRPPWDGGFTWTTDSQGRPWVVTTDQGMGASAWWPNKDTQADEPDSQRVAIRVPDPMINVSNGRLENTVKHADGTTSYVWFVKNPINNYAIAVAAGSYAHWSEEYEGERGKLTMDFWPLDYNLEKAKKQFPQARSMLKCFEHWFGPFPWYEDGFKLIEVPNNGMEHQSAIAYGNLYADGYRGRDMSGTGLGLKWDFIIIHEAAHEWWGNNITTKDLADMWVHESFANYAEGIYTECLFGKEAGARYTVGSRSGIANDAPIIPGAYNVNAEGSGDMYPKGGNMLHTIRQIVNDDEKWRAILRGLNATFWHQTVMGKQVEDYISQQSGIDLSKVFDQYLRHTAIPVFEYKVNGDQLSYRWTGAIPGFDMPMRVMVGGAPLWLQPTSEWKTTKVQSGEIKPDVNFYVTPRRVGMP